MLLALTLLLQPPMLLVGLTMLLSFGKWVLLPHQLAPNPYIHMDLLLVGICVNQEHRKLSWIPRCEVTLVYTKLFLVPTSMT